MSERDWPTIDKPAAGSGRSASFGDIKSRSAKGTSHDDWHVPTPARKHSFDGLENRGRAKTTDDMDSSRSDKAAVDLSTPFKAAKSLSKLVPKTPKLPKPPGALGLSKMVAKAAVGAIRDKSKPFEHFKPSNDLLNKPQHERSIFDHIALSGTSEAKNGESGSEKTQRQQMNLARMKHNVSQVTKSRKGRFIAKLADRIQKAHSKPPPPKSSPPKT